MVNKKTPTKQKASYNKIKIEIEMSEADNNSLLKYIREKLINKTKNQSEKKTLIMLATLCNNFERKFYKL